MEVQTLKFPEKFEVLFRPMRYKVFYGGRGSAKSWSFARALLLRGLDQSLRVLCCREQQNSMAESVHKLLSDQVDELGLSDVYTVQKDKIYGPKGTEFSFEGIKHNAKRIKSYEGIDICWIEEGDAISYESMLILSPTMRKKGSEIWISFNPNKKSDYIYRTYVLSPPENCVSVFVSWRDNPWFSQELQDEMADLKKRDYDAYLNVWEGQPKVLLTGAVYMEELRKVRAERRIGVVPHNHGAPVDTFWDLGISDSTTIWFRQRMGFEWHYIDYYEAKQKPLAHYLELLQSKNYVYGTHWLPHDARAREKGSGMSIEERFRKVYPAVRIVRRLSLADGIDAARTNLGNSWFDEKACEQGLNCLYNYRYEVVDQLSGQLGQRPVHDWASDGADSYRYSSIETSGRSKRGSDFAQKVNPEGYARLQGLVQRYDNSQNAWMG